MLDLVVHGERHGVLHDIAARAGLTPYLVKALLQLTPERPMAMRDLVGHFRCDASYVTSLVDGLEEAGMARRLPHPTDRRVKTVALTAKGARVLAEIEAGMSQPPQSFGALSDSEVRRLSALVRKLTAADEILAARTALRERPAG
jgi:DNA-binding MarR family transcriptional regulator